LSRVSFDPKIDLVRAEDTTPEHVAACVAMMEKAGGYYNAGTFTPFMYKALDAPPKSTIQTPGGTGGVNWGGMSMDPVNGVVLRQRQNTTLVGWTQPRPLATPDPQTGQPRRVDFAGESAGSDHPYDRGSVPANPNATALARSSRSRRRSTARRTGRALRSPPWSKLYAVNANSGQIVWEVPLGLNENLPAGKQLAGSGGSAGPTATAGGLVFVGATSDGPLQGLRRQDWQGTVGDQRPGWSERQSLVRSGESDELSREERKTVRCRGCRRGR
jgi:quinoprotein glucose dehydrogenase